MEIRQYRPTARNRVEIRPVFHRLPMFLQHGCADDEFEPTQEAETYFEPGQLDLADATNFCDLGVRITQVLKHFHGHSQSGEEEPVCIPLCNGDGAFVDSQSVNVQRCSEVNRRAHRAKAMDAKEVVADTDRWWFLAVELARNGAMLEVQRLAVGANDHVRFGGRGWRRRWRKASARLGARGGLEVDAVNGRWCGML